MSKSSAITVLDSIISALSYVVFLILDFLDALLCIVYRFIDEFLEGGSSSSSCYCSRNDVGMHKGANFIRISDEEGELSETLRRRRNLFRWFITHLPSGIFKNVGRGSRTNRWSDCGCESCVSWMKGSDGIDDLRLHCVVREPSRGKSENSHDKATENIIFLHGFMTSSSFWTQTVFPNLSEDSRQKYRLFAVDLLGFGASPKPKDCLYTVRDHIQMIEKTVIVPFKLKSFHLVAHSMGCVIALALGSKYSESVKSVTLIAPPYFPCSGEDASLAALEKLAAKRIWPPLLFGSAFMSWYEHLGRLVCFIICKNHRTWERILKLITRRDDLHFMLVDMTRHTHHSAWHSMHNVICGGAKLVDKYLVTLRFCGVKINVIQGSEDQVVPLECSKNIKMKVEDAKVKIVANADHSSVVLGREKEFTEDLEQFWSSVNSDME